MVEAILIPLPRRGHHEEVDRLPRAADPRISQDHRVLREQIVERLIHRLPASGTLHRPMVVSRARFSNCHQSLTDQSWPSLALEFVPPLSLRES